MSWLQLRIDADPSQVETIEDALLSAGAVSVTLEDSADQPILEPGPGKTPLWKQTRVTGLFTADTDTRQALTITENACGGVLHNTRWELLEDRDWERAWMDKFQPMCFGQRLWICPSWKAPPQPDAVNLLLDPGLAFGTGTHPTTALCLQWLDGNDIEGKSVIDYGCGSGILAIAAVLLGASHAIAVDNDPQALLATRDNAERNGIEADRIQTFLPEHLPADSLADLVLANILAGPLVELAPKLTDMTRAGGNIVLSGILASQAQQLASIYQSQFVLQAPAISGDWARLSGQRLAAGKR
jgi:ribosomal protein L11 methyltransferase